MAGFLGIPIAGHGTSKMEMSSYREKLIEKYGAFNIPSIKNNSQIMKYVGLHFEIQPISLTTISVQPFLENFKKNMLFFIYQEKFSHCDTIEEISNMEEVYNKEIAHVDINCFEVSQNKKNGLLFGRLHEGMTEKTYILDAVSYNYLESNNSLLNAILVQQRGLNPIEAIIKSDLYFAYLDVLKRLDELDLYKD